MKLGITASSAPSGTSPFGGSPTLETGLVSYFSLSSDGALADEKGDNDLTNSNATYSSSGLIGGCYAFNGSTSYLSNTNPATALPTGNSDRTINYWMKGSSYHDLKCPIGYGNGATNGLFSVFEWGNDFCIDFQGPYWSGGADSSALYDGDWHMVTITFTQSDYKARVWIDGSLAATDGARSATNTVSDNIVFGRKPIASERYWTGSICESGWWSKVLTSDEVTALYNSGAGLTY